MTIFLRSTPPRFPSTDLINFLEYNDYIDISYNTSTHECDVKLKKEFSTKILETDGPLIVQMTATDSQKNKANAILEITVRSIHAPEFNSLYYQIKYPEDGKGPVKVPIGFRNVSDDTNFVIKMTSKTASFYQINTKDDSQNLHEEHDTLYNKVHTNTNTHTYID